MKPTDQDERSTGEECPTPSPLLVSGREVLSDQAADMTRLLKNFCDNAIESGRRLEEFEQQVAALVVELEMVKLELEGARHREFEARAHVLEMTSLVKERDQAATSLKSITQRKGGSSPGLVSGAPLPTGLDPKSSETQRIRLNCDLTRIPRRADELADELSKLKETAQHQKLRDAKEITELRQQLEDLGTERDQLLHSIEEMESILREGTATRTQVNRLVEERDALASRIEGLMRVNAAQVAEIAELQLLVKEFSHIKGGSLNGRTHAMELELMSVHQHESELEQCAMEALRDQEEGKEKIRILTTRSEERRKLAVDLAQQLAEARREIIEITAQLGELRLQNAHFREAPSSGSSPDMVPESTSEASYLAEMVGWSENDLSNLLEVMHARLNGFTQSPEDLSAVHDLSSDANQLAERARTYGLESLYRLCFAFASLARHLYEIPTSLSPSTLGTMRQTIEFLLQLTQKRSLIALKGSFDARVYTVDDEPQNCELIVMGLEMVMLPADYSSDSGTALCDLANGHYDLIFLDILLPGMDGFTLCGEIRQLPKYERTPIVFLTGQDSPENRLQSSRSGGNDFVSKPFNLHELNVKALTLIIKQQLDIC